MFPTPYLVTITMDLFYIILASFFVLIPCSTPIPKLFQDGLSTPSVEIIDKNKSIISWKLKDPPCSITETKESKLKKIISITYDDNSDIHKKISVVKKIINCSNNKLILEPIGVVDNIVLITKFESYVILWCVINNELLAVEITDYIETKNL